MGLMPAKQRNRHSVSGGIDRRLRSVQKNGFPESSRFGRSNVGFREKRPGNTQWGPSESPGPHRSSQS